MKQPLVSDVKNISEKTITKIVLKNVTMVVQYLSHLVLERTHYIAFHLAIDN